MANTGTSLEVDSAGKIVGGKEGIKFANKDIRDSLGGAGTIKDYTINENGQLKLDAATANLTLGRGSRPDNELFKVGAKLDNDVKIGDVTYKKDTTITKGMHDGLLAQQAAESAKAPGVIHVWVK